MENGNCVVALRCINMHKLQQKITEVSIAFFSFVVMAHLVVRVPRSQRSWQGSEL